MLEQQIIIQKTQKFTTGGFLDHLQLEWRSEKNVLIITKNGKDICPRQVFEFEICHA